jgi:hypothetical protein
MAERLETQERTNRSQMYRMFGQIADPPDEHGFVPALADRLWARLRIPPKEIKRRMKLAGRLRLAASCPAHHCPRAAAGLAVFDNHSERPLYLGRQARIATADQRIICYACPWRCGLPPSHGLVRAPFCQKLPPAICARADVPAFIGLCLR